MRMSANFSTTARALCSPSIVHLVPSAAQDAWLKAKEDRGAPIGAAQLARPEEMPSHYPQRKPHPDAPFVEITCALEVEDAQPDSKRRTRAELDRISQRNGLVRKLSRTFRPSGDDAA